MINQRILFKNHGRYWFITAVIVVFTCTGCSESSTIISQPDGSDILLNNEEVITEYIRVLPSGTVSSVFNGSVMLDFPSGTVPTPTRFSIASFPLDHLDLDGINIMQRGITIKNITNDNKFGNPVKLLVRYDMANYNQCKPGDESDLSICKFRGDIYAYDKVESIGECAMNCSCKTICVLINGCGTYVVVEN